MTPIPQKAIEAGARALRERDMAGRITVPWEQVPKSQRKKWLDRSKTCIEAYQAALAAEGMAQHLPESSIDCLHPRQFYRVKNPYAFGGTSEAEGYCPDCQMTWPIAAASAGEKR